MEKKSEFLSKVFNIIAMIRNFKKNRKYAMWKKNEELIKEDNQ